MAHHKFRDLLEEARSAAISVRTNPRNREMNWYAFWNVFFIIITRRTIHRTTIAPQFPVWRLINGNAVQPTHDGTADDLNVGDDEHDENHEDAADLAEISFSSAGSTVHGVSRERVADFALIIWNTYEIVGQMDMPVDKGPEDDEEDIEDSDMDVIDDEAASEEEFRRPTEKQVRDCIAEEVPLLAEIKKAPSRQLLEQDWITKCGNLISTARNDVIVQACFLFNSENWQTQQKVMLIAAVGDHWTYAVMNRNQAVMAPVGGNDPEPWRPDPSILDDILHWSKVRCAGSYASDSIAAEDAVVRWLNDMYPTA